MSRRSLPPGGLLAIVDAVACEAAGWPLEEAARATLADGARWILLRETRRRAGALLATARALATDVGEATLSVSDRLDVAVAAGGLGLHLPAAGLPVQEAVDALERAAGTMGAWCVGISAHDLAAADRAFADGADYVTLSPVFETASKPDAAPVGVERLERAAAGGRPIVALGGVDARRAEGCFSAGAAAVAALSPFCSRDRGRARELIAAAAALSGRRPGHVIESGIESNSAFSENS